LGFHPAEGHSQVHSPEELDMIFTESHKGGEINKLPPPKAVALEPCAWKARSFRIDS